MLISFLALETQTAGVFRACLGLVIDEVIISDDLGEIGDRIMQPDQALRALYYTGEHRQIPAINYTLLHGVRAALALSRTSAVEERKLHNPAVAPHLKFVDLGGHGYGLVTVTADWLETEFVCIPVPFERSESAPHDGSRDRGTAEGTGGMDM